jgi:myotubularin-related protein 1/2
MAYYYYNTNSDNDNMVPTIWRSAQNKGGIMGSKKNEADMNLISYIKEKSKNLYIYDCRPKLNAMVNRLNGGGYENMDHYDNVDLTFCEIDNIHKARAAKNGLFSLCLSEKINDNYKFWSSLDGTGWFTFVYLLLKSADEISKKLQDDNSVLIHCSDGWDRTSQLSSLSQILLDPFFRTINGFAVLIEKDWLSFGHQFALRNGISTKQSNEDQSSPIFLQFLDAVHQLLLQYPNSFEFNEKFLLFLAKVHSLNLYGTFMFNNDKHRATNNAKEKTISVWTEIYRNVDPYLNIYYDPNSVKILEPNFAYYNIKLWTSFFMENNIYLRNERFFVNDYDNEVFFSNVNDFYIYEKEMDKKKMKEKDDKYDELMKLTSGFYSKIKDNEELINSLDDKSKQILEQVKSKLLLIEKMKGTGKK